MPAAAQPTPVGIAPQAWSPQMLQAAQMSGGGFGQGQMPLMPSKSTILPVPNGGDGATPSIPVGGAQAPGAQGTGATAPGTIGGYGPNGPNLLVNPGGTSASPGYGASTPGGGDTVLPDPASPVSYGVGGYGPNGPSLLVNPGGTSASPGYGASTPGGGDTVAPDPASPVSYGASTPGGGDTVLPDPASPAGRMYPMQTSQQTQQNAILAQLLSKGGAW
jgi:hypothetical protein